VQRTDVSGGWCHANWPTDKAPRPAPPAGAPRRSRPTGSRQPSSPTRYWRKGCPLSSPLRLF